MPRDSISCMLGCATAAGADSDVAQLEARLLHSPAVVNGESMIKQCVGLCLPLHCAWQCWQGWAPGSGSSTFLASFPTLRLARVKWAERNGASLVSVGGTLFSSLLPLPTSPRL